MNTIRQRVYVGVMLAALAVLVALTMMVMANQPEQYELSSTEVAGLPVLGSSSSPACAGDQGVDRGVDCATAGEQASNRVGTRIGDAEDFDMNRAAGLMRRANPVLNVPAEPSDDQASDATGTADTQDAANDSEGTDTPDTSPKPTSTSHPSTTTSTAQPPSTSESTRPAQSDDDEGSSGDSEEEDEDDESDDENKDRQGTQAALQQAGQSSAERTLNSSSSSNTGSANQAGSASGPAETSAFEQAVIDLTNKHRVSAGCEPLAATEALAGASRAHSRDMADNEYFDHTGRDGSTPGDRAMRNGYTSSYVAANIAWGYRTAEAVVEGWMGSRGHRGNMLDCRYTHIGVGFHDYYWTQTFGVPN